MAKIHAPNKNYNGLSASVMFVNGIGECTDPHLISWFKEKGYRVEYDAAELNLPIPDLLGEGDLNFEKMTVKELKEYAETNEIELGEATKKADILEKILEWEEEAEGEEETEGD